MPARPALATAANMRERVDLPGASEVEAAYQVIREHLPPTPLRYSETLSQLTGCEVWLKLETLQASGAFKVRGALNAAEVARKAGRRHLICYSSGNHARGVAWAARRLGLAATAVMPTWAKEHKIEAVRALGATVKLYGTSSVAGLAWTEALVGADDYFVHPFGDPAVVAGQGTVALEALAQGPRPDAVVAPASGGGLVGGLGLVLAPHGISLIAAQPEGSAALARSVASGQVESVTVQTSADALTAAAVSPLTLRLAQANVGAYALVRDEDLFAAARLLLEKEHVLAEPGGAAAVAAVLKHGAEYGKRLFVVVSGGNCNPLDLFSPEVGGYGA